MAYVALMAYIVMAGVVVCLHSYSYRPHSHGHIAMACMVMAYVALTPIVLMARILMAFIGMAHIGMAYMAMAYIVISYRYGLYLVVKTGGADSPVASSIPQMRRSY